MDDLDRDAQHWRVPFARVLLCIAICCYLASISLVALMKLQNRASLGATLLCTLLVFSLFAALGANRYRKTAIACCSFAAFISVAMLLTVIIGGQLPALLYSVRQQWRHALAAAMVLVIYLLPTVAFAVLWPLRRVNSTRAP
jgi:hypothetical protein